MKKNSAYNKVRRYRDIIRMICALFFLILYIPHYFAFLLSHNQEIIKKDIEANKKYIFVKLGNFCAFIYLLHTNKYFRALFYHRISPLFALILNFFRPSDHYFSISKTTIIKGGFIVAHPFATIINADKIGENFLCRNGTTIGEKNTMDDRPIIGNNVTLGASVIIVGKIKIGDNVTIGAGSVVVKDVPSNVIIAGNPAKVIKHL